MGHSSNPRTAGYRDYEISLSSSGIQTRTEGRHGLQTVRGIAAVDSGPRHSGKSGKIGLERRDPSPISFHLGGAERTGHTRCQQVDEQMPEPQSRRLAGID